MKENIDNIRYLLSDAVWYEDDQIWVSAMGFNGLFRYDINDNKTEFIGSFPNEERFEKSLHGKAIRVQDEIYFLPDRSKYVHVYNLGTGVFSSYDVKMEGRMRCGNGFYYEGKLYFICGGSEIVFCCIDTLTKKIDKHKIDIANYKYGISKDIVLLGDKVYFTCRYPNVVVEYSYRNNTYKKYFVGKEQDGFSTICHDGNVFWLSGKKGIVRWDTYSSEVIDFNMFPKGFGMCIVPSSESKQIEFVHGFSSKYFEAEVPFWFSAFFAGKVWLFPFRTNMIICVDVLTRSVTEFYLQDEQEDEESLQAKYRYTHCHYLGEMQNNKLVFFSTKSKKIRVIEQESEPVVREFVLRCKEPEDMISYLNGDKTYTCYEDGELYNLEDFLTTKLEGNIGDSSNKKSVGMLIYETIRSESNERK
ncbi:MAG: hypothetical protein J1E98_05115 [Lachnospiraceae bacterium]|nr:hypothetical protein [Lachnospiraceae bacterium]